MSTLSLPADEVPVSVSLKRLWVAASIVLALGAIVFGVAFGTEIAKAVSVWRASTAYDHCFLIIPVAAYMIWDRRAALLARTPEPSFWPLAALLPVAFAWLLAFSAGLMEGRQLAAMSMFELFVLAVLGVRAWRVIAFALLYLYFLVPFGAFLVPVLQRFSAHFAVIGLQILGIPVYADGLFIEIPEGQFLVAEACAGLRFLIASIAFGTFYSYIMYRDAYRRILFMIVSVIVPIVANGFRVLGIVYLGHVLGSAKAAESDHLIYGWVFFSFVTLLLILLGLPFRQPIAAFPVSGSNGVGARSRQLPMVLCAGAFLAVIVLLVSPLATSGPVAAGIDSVADPIKQILGR